MKPVVLAGGTGSRLWPKSRAAMPKQFLSLTSDLTMLQDTIKRLDGVGAQSPIFICNEAHRFLVAEQLRQQDIEHGGILLEPVGRNTAPAIALAALHGLQNDEDPVLLVLAADHLIVNHKQFHKAIGHAQTLAEQGKLVTFGVVPTSPHTGYGYIRRGEQLDQAETGFAVSEFVEKPDEKTAQTYVDNGDYFWNSGMFMFKASRFIEELQKFAPDMLEVCKRAMETQSSDLDFVRVDAEIFATCPEDSVDYAVMEKTDDAAMVPLDAGWNDVGSWSSLWETSTNKDERWERRDR